MYKEAEYNGMSNKGIRSLPIFEYINVESMNGYEIKKTYTGKKRIFDKEHAKLAMFKFLYEGKIGPIIGKELGDEKEIGFTNGNTLAFLRVGFREKSAEYSFDNQKGALKDKVSEEKAKELISEWVEYIY